MAIQTTPLGFKKPDGRELVSRMDNVISENAEKSEELLAGVRARVAQLEGGNGEPFALSSQIVSGVLSDRGSLASQTLDTRVSGQAQALVPPLVAAAIADDPSIVQAAANLALSDEGLTRRGDIGIPVETSAYGDDYLDAVVDESNNILTGTRKNGTKVVRGLDVAGVAITDVYTVHPYVKATVDAAGNIFEDALDENGSVPQWILNRWKTRMGATTAETVSPGDMFLVAGQSNAMNKSDWLDEAVDIEDSWVMLWDTDTKKWRPIRPDETWLGLYFGQEWVRRYRGRKVYLVPTAVGDTGFDVTRANGTWNRTDTTNPINLYNRALTTYAEATAALEATSSPYSKAGILWSQGEADSRTMTQAQYATALDDLIGAMRTAIGLPKLPFVVGSLTPELFFEYEPTLPTGVRDALRDTPRRVLYTSFVQAPNDYAKFNERVHFSVAGQRKRGALFVEGVRRAKLNISLSKPITPPGLVVRRSGSEVLISWDPPECRVTGYELTVSTDSGATWTAQALPAPLATGATLSVPVATPVWARVRCTNDQGTSYYSIPYHG